MTGRDERGGAAAGRTLAGGERDRAMPGRPMAGGGERGGAAVCRVAVGGGERDRAVAGRPTVGGGGRGGMAVGRAWSMLLGRAGRLGPRALAAVGLALLAACGGPVVDKSRPLADGVYQADSGPDEEGAVGHVVVTVADGRVSDCQFSVVQADGQVKGADYGLDSTGQIANPDYYAQAQRAVAALTVYARQLIEVGYPQDVDVIAGATWAHDQFVEAAATALEASQEAL